jgi:pimeloyl-ACP methyl ester carboxylesterase
MLERTTNPRVKRRKAAFDVLPGTVPAAVEVVPRVRQGRGRAVGPVPKVRTLDDRAADVEAVTDAVGFGTSVVFGLSDGGFASIVFAATRPERTRALILTGTVTFWRFAGWDDLDRGPAEVGGARPCRVG